MDNPKTHFKRENGPHEESQHLLSMGLLLLLMLFQLIQSLLLLCMNSICELMQPLMPLLGRMCAGHPVEAFPKPMAVAAYGSRTHQSLGRLWSCEEAALPHAPGPWRGLRPMCTIYDEQNPVPTRAQWQEVQMSMKAATSTLAFS